MGCVIFQCYPYGLANANAENFNGGGVPLHGFVTALIVLIVNKCQKFHYLSIAPLLHERN